MFPTASNHLPASQSGVNIAPDVVGHPVGEAPTQELRRTAHGEPDTNAESLLLLAIPLEREDNPCGDHSSFCHAENGAGDRVANDLHAARQARTAAQMTTLTATYNAKGNN